MRATIHWLRRARGNVCWLLGILACLVLIVLLMPLVPVLRLYDDIRLACGDE